MRTRTLLVSLLLTGLIYFGTRVASQTQIPTGWQMVKVEKLTLYLPPSAKTVGKSEWPTTTKRFDIDKLSLSFGAAKTDLDSVQLISAGTNKQNEEEFLIDGHKALFTKFEMTTTRLYPLFYPGEREYVAVGIIKNVYSDEKPNVVMFAFGMEPSDQQLAKKIFFTAHISD